METNLQQKFEILKTFISKEFKERFINECFKYHENAFNDPLEFLFDDFSAEFDVDFDEEFVEDGIGDFSAGWCYTKDISGWQLLGYEAQEMRIYDERGEQVNIGEIEKKAILTYLTEKQL